MPTLLGELHVTLSVGGGLLGDGEVDETLISHFLIISCYPLTAHLEAVGGYFASILPVEHVFSVTGEGGV